MSEEPGLAGGALDDAVVRFGRIFTEFCDEVGSAPTLGELLEIMGYVAPASSKLIEGVRLPLKFKVKVKVKGGRRYQFPHESRVAELNDSAFAEAADLMGFLAERVSEASGRPVSGDLLGRLLLQVLISADRAMLDINPTDISSIVVDKSKKIAAVQIGDVVAIPARGGNFYVSSVVARNRFGLALGFLNRQFQFPRIGNFAEEGIRPMPVYTDDLLIARGDWAIVGRDENLLSRFPSEPEIYHGTDLIFPGVSLGEFGSAESPDGRVRDIGSDEARDVGLQDGSYRQSYMSSYLQQVLDEGSLPG